MWLWEHRRGTGVALGTPTRHWCGPGIVVLAQESGSGSLEELRAGRQRGDPALGGISRAAGVLVESLVPHGGFRDFVSIGPAVSGVPLAGAGLQQPHSGGWGRVAQTGGSAGLPAPLAPHLSGREQLLAPIT